MDPASPPSPCVAVAESMADDANSTSPKRLKKKKGKKSAKLPPAKTKTTKRKAAAAATVPAVAVDTAAAAPAAAADTHHGVWWDDSSDEEEPTAAPAADDDNVRGKSGKPRVSELDAHRALDQERENEKLDGLARKAKKMRETSTEVKLKRKLDASEARVAELEARVVELNKVKKTLEWKGCDAIDDLGSGDLDENIVQYATTRNDGFLHFIFAHMPSYWRFACDADTDDVVACDDALMWTRISSRIMRIFCNTLLRETRRAFAEWQPIKPVHPYPDDDVSDADGESSTAAPDPAKIERIRQYDDDCKQLDAVYEKVQAVASELGIAGAGPTSARDLINKTLKNRLILDDRMVQLDARAHISNFDDKVLENRGGEFVIRDRVPTDWVSKTTGVNAERWLRKPCDLADEDRAVYAWLYTAVRKSIVHGDVRRYVLRSLGFTLFRFDDATVCKFFWYLVSGHDCGKSTLVRLGLLAGGEYGGVANRDQMKKSAAEFARASLAVSGDRFKLLDDATKGGELDLVTITGMFTNINETCTRKVRSSATTLVTDTPTLWIASNWDALPSDITGDQVAKCAFVPQMSPEGVSIMGQFTSNAAEVDDENNIFRVSADIARLANRSHPDYDKFKGAAACLLFNAIRGAPKFDPRADYPPILQESRAEWPSYAKRRRVGGAASAVEIDDDEALATLRRWWFDNHTAVSKTYTPLADAITNLRAAHTDVAVKLGITYANRTSPFRTALEKAMRFVVAEDQRCEADPGLSVALVVVERAQMGEKLRGKSVKGWTPKYNLA